MSFGDGDLHVENEKLRERVDSLETTNGELCGEINRQERVIERQAERIAYLERVAENRRQAMCAASELMEKRDELIRDLWSGFECGVAKACDACPSGAKLGDAPCAIEERLREFGIEVD